MDTNIGIYSKNRLRSISAEYVEECMKLTEAPEVTDAPEQEITNEAPEVTEAPEEITTEAEENIPQDYFSDILEAEEFNNIMETSVQLLEHRGEVNEQVFEINRQITEATDEEATVIGESKNEYFIENTIKHIDATKAAINQMGLRFYNEASGLANVDQEVFTKYAKRIAKHEFTNENFAGIENFCAMNEEKSDMLDNLYDIDEVFDAVDKANTDIEFAEDAVMAGIAVQQFNKALEDIKEANNERISKICATTENWIPSENDKAILARFAKDAGAVSRQAALEFTQKVVNDLEDIKINTVTTLENVTDHTKANAIFTVNTYAMAFVAEAFNNVYDLCAREYANNRKAVIICGQLLNESLEDQKLTNSIISESSDAYVYSKFDK